MSNITLSDQARGHLTYRGYGLLCDLNNMALLAWLQAQVQEFNEVREFEACLQRLAKSDPNYALWLAEGAPTVPDGAFSGGFSKVVASEDREGYIGE